MKRFLLPLVMTVLCGVQQAVAAPDAASAEAKLKLKSSDAEFRPITPKDMDGNHYFKVDKNKKTAAPDWYCLMIPYELTGTCPSKDGKTDYPLYVPELKVHVYCLFDMGKRASGAKKYVMIDKEITYVDIPLPERDAAKGEGRNKNVYAAVFVSPADAARLMEESVKSKDKADKIKVNLNDNLAAVAVEFRVGDVEVSESKSKSENPKGIVIKTDDPHLNERWWKKENTSLIDLRAISETPFAPFYAGVFPPTANLYGSPISAVPAAPLMDPSGAYVPAAATEDSPAAAVEETGKKKKGKKNRGK